MILFLFYFLTAYAPVESAWAELSERPWTTSERYSGRNGYTAQRRKLHEKWTDELLKGINPSAAPKLLLLGGGIGAGKSTVAKALRAEGELTEGAWVKTDPDSMKVLIPEYAEFLKEDPSTAASRVHWESTAIAEMLFKKALSRGMNILTESTLANEDYFRQQIELIRKNFPQYRTLMIQVDAQDELFSKRVEDRSLKEDRKVPPEMVGPALFGSRRSIAKLKEFADEYWLIDNTTKPTLRRIESGGQSQEMDMELEKALKLFPLFPSCRRELGKIALPSPGSN